MQRTLFSRLSHCGRKFTVDRQRCLCSQHQASAVAEVVKPTKGGTGNSPSDKPSQLVRRGGALALLLAMGLVGYKAFDDLIIYDRCSSKAMETASQDRRLKVYLGEGIQRGPWHWYEASLAVGHEGHSASCSFPIAGNQGSANLHLKAVRVDGKSAGLLSRLMDGGRWEVLMLEAFIPSSTGENSTAKRQRINLMQESDEFKAAEIIGGECISSSLHEV